MFWPWVGFAVTRKGIGCEEHGREGEDMSSRGRSEEDVVWSQGLIVDW